VVLDKLPFAADLSVLNIFASRLLGTLAFDADMLRLVLGRVVAFNDLCIHVRVLFNHLI
jgi:hypothetical protein